ncbi:MAG: TetR family transcriptional regulator [Parasphingorhabdus sp.]|nr:TetR family transcriptional regulator [Parasphingorhabdus sp.]
MATKQDAAAEEFDSAGARDKLIETASTVMRENDTIDLSFSELSYRSGLNSALVKYYFGNKNGLMLALLERDMTHIVDSVRALLAKDIAPDEKLRRHIGAAVDTYHAYPYLNRLLMRMVRDAPPNEAQRIAEEYLTPLATAYAQLIADGVAKGLFRDVDPQMFYFSVTGASDRFFTARFVLQHCYGQDNFTEAMRDRYREHTIDLIMAGILKKEG